VGDARGRRQIRRGETSELSRRVGIRLGVGLEPGAPRADANVALGRS
jgi:hypothetical protein